MIDVANLPNVVLSAADFSFAIGNDNNLGDWTAPPDPTYVNVYPGRGPGGSTQITIIWDDNAIENEWLRVTMLADQLTGLAVPDVFYFGNAIGETGDSNTDALVTSNDAARVSANFTGNAAVTNPYDINRDGVVDSSDVAIVNSHLTTAANGLNLITAPPAGAAPAGSASGLVWSSSAGGSIVTVSGGGYTISAPLALNGNLTVLPAAGSQLTISGDITGAGGLTVSDPGTVILSGTNAYTGGTAVTAGNVIVTSASAIPDNSNLVVGAGAGQFFASAAPAASAAAPVPTVATDTGPATVATTQPASAPVFLTPVAADAVHAGVTVDSPRRIAAGPAWLTQTGFDSDNSDQNRDKVAAILALEAVFAQYGN
jgi:autotransporter-associated beta strand protein